MAKKYQNVSSKIERLKYFIKWFFIKYQPRCYFCSEPLSWKSFYPIMSGLDRDDLTVHHVDENRENNVADNLEIAHKSCHKSYHRIDQIKKASLGKTKVYNQRKVKTSLVVKVG